MAIFIEEFLYRNPGASDPQGRPAAWHLVLGNWVDDGFGGVKLTTDGPLTPEQAAARGYDLDEVLSGINSSTLIDVDALQAEKAALEAALAARTAALENAEAEIARLNAALGEPQTGAPIESRMDLLLAMQGVAPAAFAIYRALVSDPATPAPLWAMLTSANMIRRDEPNFIGIMTSAPFSLSDEQIDAVFAAARQIALSRA